MDSPWIHQTDEAGKQWTVAVATKTQTGSLCHLDKLHLLPSASLHPKSPNKTLHSSIRCHARERNTIRKQIQALNSCTCSDFFWTQIFLFSFPVKFFSDQVQFCLDSQWVPQVHKSQQFQKKKGQKVTDQQFSTSIKLLLLINLPSVHEPVWFPHACHSWFVVMLNGIV